MVLVVVVPNVVVAEVVATPAATACVATTVASTVPAVPATVASATAGSASAHRCSYRRRSRSSSCNRCSINSNRITSSCSSIVQPATSVCIDEPLDTPSHSHTFPSLDVQRWLADAPAAWVHHRSHGAHQGSGCGAAPPEAQCTADARPLHRKCQVP